MIRSEREIFISLYHKEIQEERNAIKQHNSRKSRK